MAYPDRWTGPAAYKSNIYPDRWIADRMREPKGVTDAYRDGIKPPSVPAFVVSAKQLIKNLNSTTRGQRSAGTPTTGANNVALGARATNKRNADDIIDLVSSSPKRAKTEQPATRSVIDLTQDDEPTTKFLPTRRLPLRAAPNSTNRGTGPKPSQKRRKSTRRVQLQAIHGESLGVLAKVASKLRASAHALDVDRETLRQCWEVDEMLQLQHVTDDLAQLNGYFTASENDLYAALDVIENRLL